MNHLTDYAPRDSYSRPVDMKRCRAGIWHGYRRSQCHSRGHLEHDGKLYCGLHHPPKVIARNEEKSRRRVLYAEARGRVYQREEAKRKLQEAAVRALRDIAAGHNDPQSLARKVLGITSTEES